MDYKTFIKTWQGTVSENKFLRVILIGQSLALVIALIGWQTKDKTTVIVPPTLSEKAEISQRAATVGYKKSWGLYVAELMGNITPSNVDFIVETLSSMMSGATHSKFRTMAAVEVDNIKRNGMSISFEPRSIQYERDTDKIFITGHSTVQAAGVATPQTYTRVFEVMVDIRNGTPSISHIDTYQGQAKTRDVLEKLEKEEEREQLKVDAADAKKRDQERTVKRSLREVE